jgi:hypothetical protein
VRRTWSVLLLLALAAPLWPQAPRCVHFAPSVPSAAAAAPAPAAQDVALEVKGPGVAVVKVDRQVVVKVDVTLVSSLPFTVTAPAGAGLYFWTYPPAVTAQDRGDSLVVTAAPRGELQVGVKMISADVDKDGKFKGFLTRFGQVTFVVGEVPGPGPPDPGPKPDPKPLPVAGLRVLIVEESADRPKLPAAQQSVILGKTVRDWLDAHCADWPEGKIKDWGIFDKDADLSGYSKPLQEMMRRPRTSLPWLVIRGDSGIAYEGPLPPDVPAALNLLGKYAPAKTKKAG